VRPTTRWPRWTGTDLRPVLDEESPAGREVQAPRYLLRRGGTREEAAARLALAVRTVAGRLARARALLQRRLARRGSPRGRGGGHPAGGPTPRRRCPRLARPPSVPPWPGRRRPRRSLHWPRRRPGGGRLKLTAPPC